MTDVVPRASGLDLPSLEKWLARQGLDITPPVDAEMISGGRSNLTFKLRDALGSEYCLRRPPLGDLLRGAHDVTREYRIIRALQGSEVPVPGTQIACDDPSVIGAPFFLMDFVPGTVCADPTAAASIEPSLRRTAGIEMAETLAEIHAVDVEARGLGNLSKREDYLARQLHVWRRQVGPEELSHRPQLADVANALEEQAPRAQTTGLVHGDFKLANCIIDEQGRIRAVLDWELSTLGDPLADLGWLLASWTEPGEEVIRIVTPPTVVGGFPTREELTDAYASSSRLSLDGLPYYVAFAHWRWACIDVGISTRFSEGAMGDSDVDLNRVAGEIDDRLREAGRLLR